ncbi:MAG: dihydrolipoyl dehydrogenase family protein [Hyphomicrobiaceae bacterium]
MQLRSEDVDSDAAPNLSGTSDTVETDICVIGAGSGGLSVAAAAAAFGRPVVLVEKGRMGGDCLNFGCVPSKALITAGNRAHAMRTAASFGIENVQPTVDWEAVHGHVQQVIAAIAPNDSVERFAGLGVRVIQDAAKFTSNDTVRAGDISIKARRFVIATGSVPAVPSIPGLQGVPFFTNETLFDNTQPIDHLIVIGGGPIGMEMAQAHLRLGSRVTVVEAHKAMRKDDPELASALLHRLRTEGVIIREGASIENVSGGAGAIQLTLASLKGGETLSGSHLLVAAGRDPNIIDLGLEAAGIRYDRRGIQVDRGLVTSNRKVFAIGDCAGGPQFTHVANYHAGIVIRRALFRMPAKVNDTIIPWVTFTDPELAHCGLTEEEARTKYAKIGVLRWPFHENDRAQAERTTAGMIKVVTGRRGRILGATILGERAGELIQMWALAIAQNLKIKAMTDWISPYPTLSEVNKRVAYRHFGAAAGDAAVRRLINWLAKLG